MSHAAEDSEQAIFEVINRFVLDLGDVLLERQGRAPKSFEEWIKRLPMSEQLIRNIMAVSLAHRFDADEAPEPWSVLV